MKAIKELAEAKDPDLVRKFRALEAYLGQHTHDFYVKKNCLKMEERLVMPTHLGLRWLIVIIVFTTDAENHWPARDAWIP